MVDRVALFGAFLNEESPLYTEYNKKFTDRLQEVEREAKKFAVVVKDLRPSLAPHVDINHANIFIAVSRYFNDAIRLRTMHKISGVHRTKIAAYTAKWCWLNPILNANIGYDDYFALNDSDKVLLLNINYLFTLDLIRYFIPPEQVHDVHQMDQILSRFLYMMKVGVYEEHHAAALLETIDPINGEESV